MESGNAQMVLDTLARAFRAAAKSQLTSDWDVQFAEMSSEEQARWALMLLSSLTLVELIALGGLLGEE